MRQQKQALLVPVRRLSLWSSHGNFGDWVISMSYFSTLMSGSLILEMGALSRLTGDPQFEDAALRALRKLWSLRSSMNLLGTTVDVVSGKWIEYSSGIGAGRLSNVCHFWYFDQCIKDINNISLVAEICFLCTVGVDSFYEYLVKAYILFGKEEYWRMFQSAYVAVQKYFRHGPWYNIEFLSFLIWKLRSFSKI